MLPEKKRLRPTLLLRVVALLVGLGIFLIVVKLSTSVAYTSYTALILIVVWFIGIEGGIVPWLIASYLTALAEKGNGQESIWFRNSSSEACRTLDTFRKDSSNNPTPQ